MPRSPSPSMFRPGNGVDRAIVEQTAPLINEISRRKLLRGSFSLGALSMLTGCSVTDTGPVMAFMNAVSAFNDKVQEAIFRQDLEARSRRPGRQQGAVDRRTDLWPAGAGHDCPAHLHRRLGLYRPMVRR
jgi:hypothetical protein